jgi:hypothetical protein
MPLIEQKRNAYKTAVGKFVRRDHLVDLGVDGETMLRIILNKYDMTVSISFTWLRIGSSSGFLSTR